MKKLWIILFIVLMMVLTIGYSQTTYYANQITITWDAPTHFINDDPIPPETIITYDVYIREKGGPQVLQSEVSGPPFTITFPTPNRKYDIGVLAKYQLDSTWFYSVMNWSIDDTLNAESWDVGFFVPANPPTNVRIE